MALITSDNGIVRFPAHQMARITSGCAPAREFTGQLEALCAELARRRGGGNMQQVRAGL